MDYSMVIATAITAISGVVIVAMNNTNTRRIKEMEKLAVKVEKVQSELAVLTVFFSYNLYELIDEYASEIFATTKATRFLILFAINGKHDFHYTTVVYEHTKDDRGAGAIRRYIKIEIDNDYREMLKHVEHNGIKILDVENSMNKDSLLYQIYHSSVEKIKHSIVSFVCRKKIDSSNDVVFFASVATANEEPFCSHEVAEIKLRLGQIKLLAKDMKIEY